jgi:protein TonB
MVPPEEIEKEAPTTLPADFGEWDSGGAPEPQHASYNGFEAVPRQAVKQVTARAPVLPVTARSAGAGFRSPSTAYAEADQVFQMPASSASVSGHGYDEDGVRGNKGMKAIAAGGVMALLLAGGWFGYVKLHSKPVAQTHPVTTQQQVVSNSNPTTEIVANTPVETAAAPVAPATDTGRPLSAQSTAAMNRQLNAPSRISEDLSKLGGRPAPSAGANLNAMEGLEANSNVFGNDAGPKVKVAAQRVSLSAGVAGGLLLQSTPPSYPPMARNARIQGTVVIQATISKTGEVVDPHVVSGPSMLRESAVNAVKSWRYRPYKLDGQPVEVETTVNVVFNLGG